jgi:hypothetical protein
MYRGGMVDGQSEVRFIDIFNIKNKKPFEFFKLKDLEDVKIIDEIDISTLVKNAVLVNNYDYSKNDYNNNQSNWNINNNNYNNNNSQNQNKKHRKTSSFANNQKINEVNQANKESNNYNAIAKVTSPQNHPKEKKKTVKKEGKDLNSILEKVLKNDIKNKENKGIY